MGLFNYSKPGPGVDKNAPKKRGIFLFFEILGRKFWNMCKVNMLYFICSLPMIAIYYVLSLPPISAFIYKFAANDELISAQSAANISFLLTIAYTLIMIILFGSGPASAALSYVHRCFKREEHVWFPSDFFAKFKENFLQGLIVSVVDIVVLNIGFFAISFYYNYYLSSGSMIWFLMMCFMALFLIVYTFAHFYIYQLMVTFESKTKDLFKNAVILSLSTLPANIILSIVILGIAIFVYTMLNPLLSVILSFFVFISLLRFGIEFYAASVIEKKILNNLPQNNENEQDS